MQPRFSAKRAFLRVYGTMNWSLFAPDSNGFMCRALRDSRESTDAETVCLDPVIEADQPRTLGTKPMQLQKVAIPFPNLFGTSESFGNRNLEPNRSDHEAIGPHVSVWNTTETLIRNSRGFSWRGYGGEHKVPALAMTQPSFESRSASII